MPASLIAELQFLAKEGSTGRLGLFDPWAGSQRLYVSSNRQLIVWKTAQAGVDGGRYTPPAAERSDTVQITCGNADLGEIFECSRVRVKAPSGLQIRSLTYNAGPHAYRNALGAKWTVREVRATYPAAALKDGFSVDYASFEGTEWTYSVSVEQARDELFLAVEAPSAAVLKARNAPKRPDAIEVGPVTWKMADSNGLVSRLHWSVAVKNPGGTLSCYVTVDFQEATGTSLKKDYVANLRLPGLGSAVFEGSVPVADSLMAGLARAVPTVTCR